MRIVIEADGSGRLNVHVEAPGGTVRYPDVLMIMELARDSVKEKATGGGTGLLLANALQSIRSK